MGSIICYLWLEPGSHACQVAPKLPLLLVGVSNGHHEIFYVVFIQAAVFGCAEVVEHVLSIAQRLSYVNFFSTV